MKCLNVGCGLRFHPQWVNIDMMSGAPGVQAHDLTRGVPFPDESFDVVYHSHVLEHFPKEAGLGLIRECWRVLRTQGVLRVAVPDLEQIARMYVLALEKTLKGEAGWQERHEWMLLEMYDQVVRERSGGAMAEYVQNAALSNEEFVFARLGTEARRMKHVGRTVGNVDTGNRVRRSIVQRLRHLPSRIRGSIVQMLLGEEQYERLQIMQFRNSGEIHRWMYDQVSLGRLLKQAGFPHPTRVCAAESKIAGWASYNLDTEPDGAVYKPDSLYMEAVKS